MSMENVKTSGPIRFAGESIAGLVRKNNEDNFVIVAERDRRTALAVVADGVGGHRHGEIVSSISCRDLARAYARTADEELLGEGAAEQFLREEVVRINRRVFELNLRDRNPYPMSSTIVVLLVLPDAAVMASAGDSRLYEISPGAGVRQLSTDHTLANDPLVPRALASDTVWAAHTISRAIGPRSNLRVDVRQFPRRGDERYFLCSDGVYHDLDQENIDKVLLKAESPRQTLNRMFRAVLLRGAHDNVTAVSIFPA